MRRAYWIMLPVVLVTFIVLIGRSIVADEPIGPAWAGGAPSVRLAVLSGVIGVWLFTATDFTKDSKRRTRVFQVVAALLCAYAAIAATFAVAK